MEKEGEGEAGEKRRDGEVDRDEEIFWCGTGESGHWDQSFMIEDVKMGEGIWERQG